MMTFVVGNIPNVRTSGFEMLFRGGNKSLNSISNPSVEHSVCSLPASHHLYNVHLSFKVTGSSLKFETRLHDYKGGTNARSGTEVLLTLF